MLPNHGAGEVSNKSSLKEINPEFIGRAEAEAPTLWSPNVKSQLLEKTRMLGKTEGKRKRGGQRMR